MQLDVIHVQDVADGDSTPNSISVSTLSDGLAYGVNTYAEQQWGQCITLVYSTLDGNLCDCLGVVQDNNCVLFHSSLEFLLNGLKHSNIHVWDIES